MLTEMRARLRAVCTMPTSQTPARMDLVAVVELDPKVTAFRDQDDFAVEMYELFFAHRVLIESGSPMMSGGPPMMSGGPWISRSWLVGPLVSTIRAPGKALRSQG